MDGLEERLVAGIVKPSPPEDASRGGRAPRSVKNTFRCSASVSKSRPGTNERTMSRQQPDLGRRAFGQAGDDERDTGLVDQDGVRLVHDRGGERAADAIPGIEGRARRGDNRNPPPWPWRR